MSLLTGEKGQLLNLIRSNETASFRKLCGMVLMFSLPAMLAQISSILMQCIDAAMVGSLGASATASIGIVSTTIWLFSGICHSSASGFSVQVAHLIGAKKNMEASSVLRQGLICALILSVTLMLIGTGISPFLPKWLGGGPEIQASASAYFFIYAMALPIIQINCLSASMLRCSGNMFIPGMLSVMKCLLDVVLNFFFIFPTRIIHCFGFVFTMPGFGLGVKGAAYGTLLAELTSATLMIYFLCIRSKEIGFKYYPAPYKLTKECIGKAVKIGLPMAMEHCILCIAQIIGTMIVAPLGTIAIAANSLGITAESLCYMPGYGIEDAAITLIGQSLGAKRNDLARRFSGVTLLLGIGIMTTLGVVMYIFAPEIFGLLTPDIQVQTLGAEVLRIEAFAEPMFAASIVAYGIFVGAGDTLIPCIMNLGSMWVVRLSLAAILAPVMGLKGVWLAMCIELCFRGLIFLFRMTRVKWLRTD